MIDIYTTTLRTRITPWDLKNLNQVFIIDNHDEPMITRVDKTTVLARQYFPGLDVSIDGFQVQSDLPSQYTESARGELVHPLTKQNLIDCGIFHLTDDNFPA